MTKTLLLAAGLLLFGAPVAPAATTDPHTDTTDHTSCLFCHFPEFETAAPGEYTLLEDSIDAVCLTCHVKTECCEVGQKHMNDLFIGYSHPSNVEEGEMKRESRPKTLPLHDGKMTCNTCHFHRRPEGRDFKLVRIVEFVGDGVDWTPLCHDCHAEL